VLPQNQNHTSRTDAGDTAFKTQEANSISDVMASGQIERLVFFDKTHEDHQLSQVGFTVQHSYLWYPSSGNVVPNVVPPRLRTTSDLRTTMGGIKCVIFLALLRHRTGAARPVRGLLPVKTSN